MPPRVPCTECGTEILPATAQRTQGKCMLCFNDRSGIRAAALKAGRTSTEALLTELETAYTTALLELARTAAAELGPEGIYGFWITHTQLLSAQATVFTEAGLQQVSARYVHEEVYPGMSAASIAAQLRWSFVDSPYYRYREERFEASDHLFLVLENKGLTTSDRRNLVTPILNRALQAVQHQQNFPVHTVLSISDHGQSASETLACAAHFCTPATLAQFQMELLNRPTAD